MPPTPSTCLSCGQPFPANRELAAIPDASSIAFDPVRGRVWRVCASCDEWNLLGPEAAAAAMPELQARFASLVPAAVPELAFAPVRVSGRLELLRLGPPSANTEVDRAALRLKVEVDRRARLLRWTPLVLVGLGLALVADLVWSSQGEPTVPVMMLQMYSLVVFFTALSKKLYGEKIWRGTLPLSASLMVAAIAWLYLFTGWEHLKYSVISTAMMLPYFFIIEPLMRRHVGILRFKLSDGRRLRISERAAPEVSISWTPDGTDVTLHDLPNDRPVAGPDVPMVYRKLYGWVTKEGTLKAMVQLDTITEDAYRLLQTVGGLSGLLRSLNGFRRDRDGRVLLADLPVLYRVALDLALSVEFGGSDALDKLRDRALVAAAVAEEAESLDDEQR